MLIRRYILASPPPPLPSQPLRFLRVAFLCAVLRPTYRGNLYSLRTSATPPGGLLNPGSSSRGEREKKAHGKRVATWRKEVARKSANFPDICTGRAAEVMAAAESGKLERPTVVEHGVILPLEWQQQRRQQEQQGGPGSARSVYGYGKSVRKRENLEFYESSADLRSFLEALLENRERLCRGFRAYIRAGYFFKNFPLLKRSLYT